MFSRKWLLFVAALVLTASSFCAMAADAFDVSAKLTYEGKVFASPSAIVKPNTPVHMSVSGPDGYKLAMVITEVDAKEHKIKLSVQVDSSHGKMSPKVVTYLGKPASITVGDMGLVLEVKPVNE